MILVVRGGRRLHSWHEVNRVFRNTAACCELFSVWVSVCPLFSPAEELQ